MPRGPQKGAVRPGLGWAEVIPARSSAAPVCRAMRTRGVRLHHAHRQ